MSKNTNKFIRGAFILTMAGIISRMLGPVYRLPLASLLGDEGIGLYQMAYPIYTTVLAISMGGIPVAISKLVAEKMAEDNTAAAYRVFRIAMWILFFVGLGFSVLLYVSAPFLANNILSDPRSYYAVIGIAPAIFLVSIMAVFRGFFQGQQEMMPTAISKVVEQIVRVATVFFLAVWLLPRGIEYAAGGATFGAVTGALAGLVVLLFIFWRDRHKYSAYKNSGGSQISETTSSIAYRIASLAIPISLGGLILPIMQALDTVIVPSRLQAAGYAMNEATALFGQLTGMAAPLINLPTIFTYALATSLVPAISEAISLRDTTSARLRALTAIRITYVLTLPAAAGLFFLAEPITIMLYNNADAAIPLTYMAWGLIFLCLQQTTSGVLQGLGRTSLPVRNLFFGAIVKVIINYTLTGIPAIGIKGAAIGSVLGFYVASGLNFREVRRYLDMKVSYKELLGKPIISVVAMIAAVWLSYAAFYYGVSSFALSERITIAISTLGAISIGAIVYVVVLLLLGAVGIADLELLSAENSKPAVFLRKVGLLRR
jgi:stage V sporulation protein B